MFTGLCSPPPMRAGGPHRLTVHNTNDDGLTAGVNEWVGCHLDVKICKGKFSPFWVSSVFLTVWFVLLRLLYYQSRVKNKNVKNSVLFFEWSVCWRLKYNVGMYFMGLNMTVPNFLRLIWLAFLPGFTPYGNTIPHPRYNDFLNLEIALAGEQGLKRWPAHWRAQVQFPEGQEHIPGMQVQSRSLDGACARGNQSMCLTPMFLSPLFLALPPFHSLWERMEKISPGEDESKGVTWGDEFHS